MQKILVTSALPYVNGVPHLGHLVGCLLPSDVYARFMRMMGHEVLYICGTDEHGTPSEVGAAQEGMDVYDYCTKYFLRHKATYEEFNLSFSYLGRTSSEQNKELVYHIFSKLDENGYITEKSVKQVYSIDDGRFLPDRYIIGTCPYCGYDKARGDQCEKCTKVLDPTDLINARSAISGSTNLEVRESKHLYINLPKLEAKLSDWVKTKEPFWPDIAYSIAQKWLKEGLQERGITRDLKWGFPVNKPGYEDKVFYVWFDAPIGYIGITKQWSDEKPDERDWKDWWLDAKNLKYVQFMGKDNVPFHSITFPATLLGTEENWTFVDYLKGMSYLTFEGGKFSKSEKRGIFAEDAVKELPADYWRYWLMSNAPEASDTSFTFDGFASAINKDLNGVFGNFVSRVMKMTASKFGEEVPEAAKFDEIDDKLVLDLKEKTANYIKYLSDLEFRKAFSELRAIWVDGNNYISATEPWNVIKESPERASTILNICLNLIRIYAILSYPVMPAIAQNILAKFGLTVDDMPSLNGFEVGGQIRYFKTGHKFNVGDPVFERITPEKTEELKQKYGGSTNEV
ncbi:MAG: methionine--tRNA ligase [Lactobacillaceae bacterium]|jgi:methionyl-tRNA synthetase|nr:methionine--tRNA ligase [Lactobacillaceae bacterium]